jgi:hypothetical protein
MTESAGGRLGNGGGALVDKRGNVVGVVSAKLNASAALVASGGSRTTRGLDGRQSLLECGSVAGTNQTDEDDAGDSGLTFDRRRKLA